MSALTENPAGQSSDPAVYASLGHEVMERCDTLAECSDDPGCLSRVCFSPAMQRAHQALSGWMSEAGLEVRLDAVGNLCGIRRAAADSADSPAKTLLIGSHLDTVPNAGKYDGQLGILCGIAIAKALGKTPLPFNVEVIAFTDEEGVRFSQPYLGSSALSGNFPEDCLDRLDLEGHSLGDSLKSFLKDLLPFSDAARPSDSLLGYLEIHIEQGPVLEKMALPVAAVEGIAGQDRIYLEFAGEAGHAGTVPMAWRHDAGLAAARLVIAVREEALKIEGLRATVGKIAVEPDVRNVIPALARLSIDVRHIEDGSRELGVSRILERAERIAEEEGTPMCITQHRTESTVRTDPMLTARLKDSIADCGFEPFVMHSGAGHDTVAIAPHFPATMLFVRHPGGVSHHPDERVDEPDVAAAVKVATQFVKSLAN